MLEAWVAFWEAAALATVAAVCWRLWRSRWNKSWPPMLRKRVWCLPSPAGSPRCGKCLLSPTYPIQRAPWVSFFFTFLSPCWTINVSDRQFFKLYTRNIRETIKEASIFFFPLQRKKKKDCIALSGFTDTQRCNLFVVYRVLAWENDTLTLVFTLVGLVIAQANVSINRVRGHCSFNTPQDTSIVNWLKEGAQRLVSRLPVAFNSRFSSRKGWRGTMNFPHSIQELYSYIHRAFFTVDAR